MYTKLLFLPALRVIGLYIANSELLYKLWCFIPSTLGMLDDARLPVIWSHHVN